MSEEVVEGPNWLKELEARRERRLKAKLGHESGAGSPCLTCKDGCPGLDLHFWRKICKNCRCGKESHDVQDDDIYGWAQFQLLGSKPNKPRKIVLPGKKEELELEWTPTGQKEVVENFLKELPQELLPVKGSAAAQERKQLLQKQIPLHDIDPSLCHALTSDEVAKMNDYIMHVKEKSVGVGQIVQLNSPQVKATLVTNKTKSQMEQSEKLPNQQILRQKLHAENKFIEAVERNLQNLNLYYKKLDDVPVNVLREVQFGIRDIIYDANLNYAPKTLDSCELEQRFDANRNCIVLTGKRDDKGLINGTKLNEKLPKLPNYNLFNLKLADIPENILEQVQLGWRDIEFDSNVIHDPVELHRIGLEPSYCRQKKLLVLKAMKGLKPAIEEKTPVCMGDLKTLYPVIRNVYPYQIQSIEQNPALYGLEINCNRPPGNSNNSLGSSNHHLGSSNFLPNSSIPLESFNNPLGTSNYPLGSSDYPLGNSNPLGGTNNPLGNSNLPLGGSNYPLDNSNPLGKTNNPLGSSNLSLGSSNYPLGSSNSLGTSNNPIGSCNYPLGSSNPLGTSNNPLGSSNYPLGNSNSIGTSNNPLGSSNLPLGNSNYPLGSSNPLGGSNNPLGTLNSPLDNSSHPSESSNIEGLDEKLGNVSLGNLNNPLTLPKYSDFVKNALSKIDPNQDFTPIEGEPLPPLPPYPDYNQLPFDKNNKQPQTEDISNINRLPSAKYNPNSLSNVYENVQNPTFVNVGAINDITYPGLEIKNATNKQNEFYEPAEYYPPPEFDQKSSVNCHRCSKPFSDDSFAINLDRNNTFWHIDCFKCAGCNQSLADMIYFYDKESDNIYCGRDYAKIRGFHRCYACDELIFVKEYCLAENMTFHVKHFCCFDCDKPLAGQSYVMDDNSQHICLPCYEKFNSAKCNTCKKAIQAYEQGAKLEDIHFHADDQCFCCKVCRKPLLGNKFMFKNTFLYCSGECFRSDRV